MSPNLRERNNRQAILILILLFYTRFYRLGLQTIDNGVVPAQA